MNLLRTATIKNLKILIVDDEPRLCDSIKMLLCTQGYEVQTCNSGNDALNFLMKNEFGLVLLDVFMEGMDGFQVIENIINQKIDTPVIIITGNASTESAVKAFRMGANDYLKKPFEPEELYASVRNVLNRRALEKKLKEIINKNPMSIQILDKEGLTVEVNPSYKLLFGSVPPSDYSIFNDRQLLQKGMGKLFDRLRNGEIVYFPELYFNAHDSLSEFPDAPAWIRTIGFPLKGISEKPERFVLMHENITERRQVEKELLFKKNIIKSSSCAIATCDLEWNMTYGNPFFQKQWGFDNPGEFLGNPFQKLWLIEDQDETIMKTLQSKGTWAGELKGIRKDGSLFDVQVSAATVCDDSGNPVALTSTSIDITERKWADEVLRESDERRRLFLDNVPGLSIQGYKSGGETVYWNHASETLYGYTAGEAIGKNILDLIIPSEMKTEVQSAINQMLATGEPIPSSELTMKRKDGSYVCVYSGHAIVQMPGKEPQLFCMDFDLTDRKAAEAQHQQIQKVESLRRMAGAIAHNFNNQLQTVMGNLEIAMSDLPQDINSNENLSMAMQAAHKAAEVSRQLLIYLGQTPGKHKPIDLTRACRQNLPLFQAVIPKGIIVNVDFPDSGPVIRADEGQINQALGNLITNAWESISNNQGTIGLAIRTVDQVPTTNRFPIDWQPKHFPHACLEVSDTGYGITGMDIEKLFDPFFTTKFTGRGMGLPIVMGIVKAHGGCITVDSEPRLGSTFRIYLPISMEKIPWQKEKQSVAPDCKIENRGTVMLIEDEEMIRNMAKTMLIRFGYKVIEAQDGVEALEIFQQRQNEVCCIVSDLTMPRMGGWETLSAIRKIRSDVPVILASGHNKDVVMAGNHSELPQAFLYKPYSMSALKEALSKAMSV